MKKQLSDLSKYPELSVRNTNGHLQKARLVAWSLSGAFPSGSRKPGAQNYIFVANETNFGKFCGWSKPCSKVYISWKQEGMLRLSVVEPFALECIFLHVDLHFYPYFVFEKQRKPQSRSRVEHQSVPHVWKGAWGIVDMRRGGGSGDHIPDHETACAKIQFALDSIIIRSISRSRSVQFGVEMTWGGDWNISKKAFSHFISLYFVELYSLFHAGSGYVQWKCTRRKHWNPR